MKRVAQRTFSSINKINEWLESRDEKCGDIINIQQKFTEMSVEYTVFYYYVC